jgi:hypothetical protein
MNDNMTLYDAADQKLLYNVGIGNWHYFNRSNITIDRIHEAAAEWARRLQGIEYLWLCWNVDSDWCRVQQKLVKAVGWTPLVGFDPRVGPPPLEPGAILIDFNAHFQLPTMWLHFPLEFAHLFSNRLAFWHSDCLLRINKMERLAQRFRNLRDGEMVATKPYESWKGKIFGNPRLRRYWELVGCTTRGASRSQFEQGCGWWILFNYHPFATPEERIKRSKYYWDHGAGIRYWHKHCSGKVHLIPEKYVAEGHFTRIGRTDYKTVSPSDYRRNLSLELSLNTDLKQACHSLGLDGLLNNDLPNGT